MRYKRCFQVKILGIIPARYDSARFPGKPLALIAGKPMIQRVYEQCKKVESLTNVIVATDDERIYNVVKEFGGHVMMTSSEHLNGTSRCAEALEKLNEAYEFVINIQGDEPLINPNQIDELAALFQDANAEIVTQVKKETDLSLLENKNIVKAILDEDDFATDFKRVISNSSEINSDQAIQYFFKHVGIYGFRADVLQRIVTLAPTQHELEHHLEQLRWLDNGFKIKAGITAYESISVDTKDDLEKVVTSLLPLP